MLGFDCSAFGDIKSEWVYLSSKKFQTLVNFRQISYFCDSKVATYESLGGYCSFTPTWTRTHRLSGLTGRLHFPLEAWGAAVPRMCPGCAVHVDGAEGTGHTESQSVSGCLHTQIIPPQLQSCSGLRLELPFFQKGTSAGSFSFLKWVSKDCATNLKVQGKCQVEEIFFHGHQCLHSSLVRKLANRRFLLGKEKPGLFESRQPQPYIVLFLVTLV